MSGEFDLTSAGIRSSNYRRGLFPISFSGVNFVDDELREVFSAKARKRSCGRAAEHGQWQTTFEIFRTAPTTNSARMVSIAQTFTRSRTVSGPARSAAAWRVGRESWLASEAPHGTVSRMRYR